ncbi:hypothetical protein [Nocardioides litoris]|uniref:hypothetical protein n=1 Tax=Nocardioides litoris TaxID=1926648 RepID=UPI0011234EF8|nr:hypothetical protein [Nocardioides litoris]
MLHRSAPRRGLAAAALLLALAGCGSGDVAGDLADVPEECAAAFPAALVAADLADVTLRPADFPEPPVEATLCETSQMLDGSAEIAGYATTSDADAVLDGYETALASYDVVREDRGAGDTVSADLGGVGVEVSAPVEGRFSVTFIAS